MEEGWERAPRVELPQDQLQTLIEPAFPGAIVAEHTVLAAGLANTNLRFRLRGSDNDYVLRLHTREPRAAARESALMGLLARNGGVPVAPLVYSDPTPARGQLPYSIWGFVEGTLLQELFATLPLSELLEIAAACGRTLAAIASYPFPSCGELNDRLEIAPNYGAPSQFVPDLIRSRPTWALGTTCESQLAMRPRRLAPRRLRDPCSLTDASRTGLVPSSLCRASTWLRAFQLTCSAEPGSATLANVGTPRRDRSLSALDFAPSRVT